MFKEFSVKLPEISGAVYNIKNYGAVGDGITSNTEAFRKAVRAAADTSGQVLFLTEYG